MPLRDLRIELPQLREMLEAIESTEVAEQNQNRRPPQQSACGVDVAVDRHEVEVEIDPHRLMMRSPER